jgi:hypothetical protein
MVESVLARFLVSKEGNFFLLTNYISPYQFHQALRLAVAD